jgi:hypothetical protein
VVELPASLVSISANAFDGCSSLVELPAGLTSIGNYAFPRRTQLVTQGGV